MSEPSPTVYKRQLGMALRALRDEAGRTREEASSHLGCSPSKIFRVERGEVSMKLAELRSLLDFYDAADEERVEVEQLGKEARRRRPRTEYGALIPDFFRRYVHLEEDASEILVYNSELVPGLLQTEDYARAITVANPLVRPRDVDRLIQARKARQARLTAPNPLRLSAVISEAVLRSMVGGADVMRQQVMHLREMGELPSITIQVIPLGSGAHAATGLPFLVLHFAEAPTIVYLEHLTSASYVPDPGHIADYELVFRSLLGQALSPTDSAALLDTVAGEL